MEIIYESKRPMFCLGRDSCQWVLGHKKVLKGLSVAITAATYHSNLALALEELAEQQFRKNTNKLKELKDLDKSIIKTYQLIEKVAKSLSRMDTIKGGEHD